MDITISHVLNTDVPILKSIAKRAMRQSVDAENSEKERLLVSICSDIEKYIDHTESVYLKATKGPACGYILVKEYWNLAHLFVLPEFQGRGAGKALLEQALQVCRDNDEKGFVRVNSSLNAKEFYESQGFVAFDEAESSPDFVVPLVCRFSNEVRK